MSDDEKRTSILRRRSLNRDSSVVSRGQTSIGRHSHTSDIKNRLGSACKFAERRIAFTKKDRLCHTHILGSTGTGKSKFMELLMRSDMLDRKSGFCLIDPHGSLYEDVLLYASHHHPHMADRFVLFDPAHETGQILGFNPIPPDALDTIDYVLEMMISGCLKAWGQDNTDRTPRISKWLENLFLTVIANDLTLVETAPLLSVSNRYADQRNRLLANVTNELVLDDWEMFEASTNTQKQMLIEGAANRMRKFLRNEAIRNMLGQQEHVVDLAKIMDEGKILLVNLNGGDRISFENTKLVGIMLVNELFRVAKLRNPHDPNLRPFHLYIDEFANFITRDIARALEECRKFKLFLILAHQHLAQLQSEDEYLYASVLTNCKNKVVFGGLSREDAEIMGQEVSTGFHDLLSIKDEVYSTKVHHEEETRVVRGSSRGATKGESQSESLTETTTRGSSEAHGTSESETITEGETTGTSDTEGSSSGTTQSRGTSRGTSDTEGQSHGTSRGTTKGQTHGRSHSVTDGYSDTEGESESETRGHSDTRGQSSSETDSRSSQTSHGTTSNHSSGSGSTMHPSGDRSRGNSMNDARGSSDNRSEGQGHSTQRGQSEAHTDSQSSTSGRSRSHSQSHSESHGTNESESFSESESHSDTQSRSHAVQESESQSLAESESRSESHSMSHSESRSVGHTSGTSRTTTRSESRSEGKGETKGSSSSESESQSESVVPFLNPVEYKELTARTFWSIQELEHMAMAQMKNQGVGVAFIKKGDDSPIQTSIEHVKPVAFSQRFSPKKIETFRQKVFAAHPECYLSALEAVEIQQLRQVEVFGEALHFDEKPRLVEGVVVDEDLDDVENPFAHE